MVRPFPGKYNQRGTGLRTKNYGLRGLNEFLTGFFQKEYRRTRFCWEFFNRSTGEQGFSIFNHQEDWILRRFTTTSPLRGSFGRGRGSFPALSHGVNHDRHRSAAPRLDQLSVGSPLVATATQPSQISTYISVATSGDPTIGRERTHHGASLQTPRNQYNIFWAGRPRRT